MVQSSFDFPFVIAYYVEAKVHLKQHSFRRLLLPTGETKENTPLPGAGARVFAVPSPPPGARPGRGRPGRGGEALEPRGAGGGGGLRAGGSIGGSGGGGWMRGCARQKWRWPRVNGKAQQPALRLLFFVCFFLGGERGG